MPADVNFEQLLDEYNQEYVESEAYSRWMPPVGDYIVVISKINKGTAPQDVGKDLMWWRLTGQIVEEGTHKDRTFMVGYYTNKAFGFIKAATEALTGTPAKNLREADEVLSNAGGLVLRVTVEEVWSKKHDRNFKNATIESVLEAETQDANPAQ